MTAPADRPKNVRSYLKQAGWNIEDYGVAGELWRKANDQDDSVVIAVPSKLSLESTEWKALVERIAQFYSKPPSKVEFEIEHLYVDVTRFRAANKYVIDESIPLTTGVGLISTAYRILRASATTARQSRSQIAGNFSKAGDEIAQRARLGHTERGSYILPVLMPLSITEADQFGTIWDDQSNILGRVPLETSERRVTRTMAGALGAISRYVIEPASDPTPQVVPSLVASGVSRELVLAVEEVLEEAAVAEFECEFLWASGINSPSGVPNVVKFPADASDLLRRTAQLLRNTKKDPTQRVSGPIVQVRHLPEESFGEFALQTVRHGRNAEIRVIVDVSLVDEILEWMKTSRTVVVEGQVLRDPGKPLKIESPSQIYPLDESMLFVQ